MKHITPQLIEEKIEFINEYKSSQNAATGSKYDANANVDRKNIATLSAEINKDINIAVNLELLRREITKNFGTEVGDQLKKDLDSHVIYLHDSTSLMPYCVSMSMYPFLIKGLRGLGGESDAPKNLNSFCGSFINLVFAVAAQFAGAVATVEFLMYFDHFAKISLGDEYLSTEKGRKKVHQYFQQVVYSLNQPAAARGYQSVFWNISLYDRNYFDSLFGTFVFPDGTQPNYDSIDLLQREFMKWFRNERKRAVLTFPVVTSAMLVDEMGPLDKEYQKFNAQELAAGNSFFVYQSTSADSLASCCRLRNEFTDNTFSYSLGAGGVSTGSINVITINMNRVVQLDVNLEQLLDRLYMYQYSYRKIMDEYKEAGLLPVYDEGFITLDKQFLTIGINGMVEAAESKGITVGVNSEYKEFVEGILKTIYTKNKKAKEKYGVMFNTEFVPAENLGVKNSKFDRKDGLIVNRDCYNSYFYIVEDESINIVDKFQLHGKNFTQYLDGGSALHLNLDTHLDEQGYSNLLELASKTGCNYFCTNVKVTVCNHCHFIDVNTTETCSECGSHDIDYATRVIGYLKRVSAFSSPRQVEEHKRFYHEKNN